MPIHNIPTSNDLYDTPRRSPIPIAKLPDSEAVSLSPMSELQFMLWTLVAAANLHGFPPKFTVALLVFHEANKLWIKIWLPGKPFESTLILPWMPSDG